MSARPQRRALCAITPARAASATHPETSGCGRLCRADEGPAAEARTVAAREKQLAFEMARDGRECENAIRPAMATLSPPRPMAAAPG
jgi:hypothetical protein